MLRIAHISDLHIRVDGDEDEKRTTTQSLAKFVLDKVGIEVHAGGHDPIKLTALKACLGELRPDIIAVTGDITNFGDRPSFAAARAFLEELRLASGAKAILCVPGNHDCLIERAELARRQGGWLQQAGLWIASKVNRVPQILRESAEAQFYRNGWLPGTTAMLLGNYGDFCLDGGYGTCDPSQPVVFDAGWGTVSFFPFNSVNGPGLMANKGEIGNAQLAKLGVLWKGATWNQHRDAVRIALLHHHPVSAPQALDNDINRAYDWMDDGPRMLNALNDQRFHFVLHGHQHQPFTCSIDYGQRKARQTLIVAAGSATQGLLPHAENSFNVIDLVSPYEARIRRYKLDLVSVTFRESAEVDRVFPLEPLEDVRLADKDRPTGVEDWALQALVRNSFRDFDELGEAFEYEILAFDVTITPDHLYRAKYRRRGTLRHASGALGPVFIITGSPAMESAGMNLVAYDHLDAGAALGAPELLEDEGNFKVVRVRTRSALSVGESFDVELCFAWQASAHEPNHFDAVSLMGFRYPVRKVSYRVTVPWRATQLRLSSIAAAMEQVGGVKPSAVQVGGDWQYGFELSDPRPVAYLFTFAP